MYKDLKVQLSRTPVQRDRILIEASIARNFRGQWELDKFFDEMIKAVKKISEIENPDDDKKNGILEGAL